MGEKLLPVTTRAVTPRAASADPWGLLRWGKHCGNGGGDLLRAAFHILPFALLLALFAVASNFVLGGFSQQPFRQSLIVPLSVSRMSSPATTSAAAAAAANLAAPAEGASSKFSGEEGSVFGGFADPAADRAELGESAQGAEVAEAESAKAELERVSARKAEIKESSPKISEESVADVTARKEKEKSTGRRAGKGKPEKRKEKGGRPSDTNERGIREAAVVGESASKEVSSNQSGSDNGSAFEASVFEAIFESPQNEGDSKNRLGGASLVATDAIRNESAVVEESQELRGGDVEAASTVEKTPKEEASTGGETSTGEATMAATETVGEASAEGEASAVGGSSAGKDVQAETAKQQEDTLVKSAFVAVTEGDFPSRLGVLCAAPSVAAVLAARNVEEQDQAGQARAMAVVWKGGDDLFGGLPGKEEIRRLLARRGGEDTGNQTELQQQQQQQREEKEGAVDSWPELRLSDAETGDTGRDGMVEIKLSPFPHSLVSRLLSFSLRHSLFPLPPPYSFAALSCVFLRHASPLFFPRAPSNQPTISPLAGVTSLLRLSFLSYASLFRQTSAESCSVRALETACLGGLRPSAGVAAIMRAHPASALSALPRSSAVYLERGAAAPGGYTCGGCRGNSLRDCTVRTLAWRYLRAGTPPSASADSSSSSAPPPSSSSSFSSYSAAASFPADSSPASDFTIAAFEPSDAEYVASTFHPLRAPRILPVTALRLAFCSHPSLPPAAAASPLAAPPAAAHVSDAATAEEYGETSPASTEAPSESSSESSSTAPGETSPESSSIAETSPAAEESRAGEAEDASLGIEEERGEEGIGGGVERRLMSVMRRGRRLLGDGESVGGEGSGEEGKGEDSSAESSAESSEGEAESSEGEAESSKGEAESSKGEAESSKGEAESKSAEAQSVEAVQAEMALSMLKAREESGEEKRSESSRDDSESAEAVQADMALSMLKGREGGGGEGEGGEGESGALSVEAPSAEAVSAEAVSTEKPSAEAVQAEMVMGMLKGRVESGEWSCAQLQVAEAWVVSAAAALIHTRASLEARFFTAQATAGTARQIMGLEREGRRPSFETSQQSGERGSGGAAEGAEGGAAEEGAEGGAAATEEGGGASASGVVPLKVHSSVCDSRAPTPFVNRRYLQQFLVDEQLKTVYCFVPKAGCTGWKVWFRQQQNRPNATDAWIAHDPKHSGLKLLAFDMQEREVIRFLTRPDYFKFTFVRNPYTRLPSAYLNKHVGGGPPHDREYWNARFFHNIAPYRQLLDRNNGSDLFDFPDFVELTWHMEKNKRCIMDPHIMPEADVCELHRIKYDYVGRFENYEHDVAEVLSRFGKDANDAFSIGRGVHPTDASDKTYCSLVLSVAPLIAAFPI
ncbi:unnamed protein product [Closterium sp. NIES-65]|nr:unnamed protein product [Closterium sp. NIES-65]